MNNLLKPIKKLFLLFLLIVVTLVASACGRGVENAKISNPDDFYISVVEGDYTYSITKGELYSELKGDYGLNSLLNLIDQNLLANVNGVNYLKNVTDEEIAKEIEEATFPDDNKDELTADEIKEAEEEFVNSMYTSYGYLKEEQIKEHYRMILAKEAYAKDCLDAEIDAVGGLSEYFTTTEINSKYNANYKNEYWSIILPYTSVKQYTVALQQVGVVIEGGKWLQASSKAELTDSEIVKAFIDLYNMMYGYKAEGYPTNYQYLAAGADGYSLENGTYSFAQTSDSPIYYTETTLTSLHSTVATYVKDKMSAYNEEEATNWYTARPLSYDSGSLNFLVLKAAAKDVVALDDVKTVILDELYDAKVTTSYIEQQLAKLRANNNIVIYDTALQTSYMTKIASYSVDYDEVLESQETVIAIVNNVEYTADQLFHEMDVIQGPAFAVSQLLKKRLLYNPEINTYYNYNTGKWISKEKQAEYKELVKAEKTTFENGDYSSYGYDPSTMKWKQFIVDAYGVDSEEELALLLLTDTLSTEFAASLKNLTEKENDAYVVGEDDALWVKIQEVMQKQVDEYFSVQGFHFLICAYANTIDQVKGSSIIDPEEWTEYQRECGKELYAQVLAYLKTCINDDMDEAAKSTAITKGMQRVVSEFAKAPSNGVNSAQPEIDGVTYTFENIEISKFKSAGLSVRYESLGTFANGSMVTPFNDAVKAIWDKNPDSEDVVINEEVIETTFGYHLYVNTKCTPLTEWSATLEFRINADETEIQYRYVSDIEWTRLMDLPSAIEKGQDIKFRTSGDLIQWQVSGSSTWTDLVSFDEIEIAKTKEGVLPTLGIIRRYVDSSVYSTLTDTMKTAYTKYFDSVYTEVGGSYYPIIQQLNALKGFEFNLYNNANFNLENINYVIDMYIAEYNKNLTYLNE